MKTTLILLVADDAESSTIRDQLKQALDTSEYGREFALEETAFGTHSDRLSQIIETKSASLLLMCLPRNIPASRLRTVFDPVGSAPINVPVFAVLNTPSPNQIREALRLGCSDFMTLPLKAEEVAARIWNWIGPAQAVAASPTKSFGDIVGEHPAFLEALRDVPKFARCASSVLLTGETGTGKEVVARAVHYLSHRAALPFVPVNCGAIPVDLLENEFFGHEIGAYTSANHSKHGVVREAEGGTLFLDEIDTLPLAAQVKLLRFLQDGQYRPLGSAQLRRGDVRIIAASNCNFQEAMKLGRFRADLYYRLNVLSLRIPPLRERIDDVLLLARHFLRKCSQKFPTAARDFSQAARAKLSSYDWPGNVRELENVVEGAAAITDSVLVPPENLRMHTPLPDPRPLSFKKSKALAVARFEKSFLAEALAAHDGNITKAAAASQKARRAFWGLLRKHRLLSAIPPSK